MSESWDFYCLTCEAEAGLDWNHGNVALASVWRVREAIVVLANCGESIDVARFGYNLPMDWIVKHKDHDVRPRSEYGRIDGACNADINCPTCGHRTGRCGRDSDHDGDHTPTPSRTPPPRSSPA